MWEFSFSSCCSCFQTLRNHQGQKTICQSSCCTDHVAATWVTEVKFDAPIRAAEPLAIRFPAILIHPIRRRDYSGNADSSHRELRRHEKSRARADSLDSGLTLGSCTQACRPHHDYTLVDLLMEG